MHESHRWLEWLYGPEPEGLIWIGGHGDKFAGRTFTNIPDAVEYAGQLDASAAGGVYHRLTTMRPVGGGRGAAADSAYLPALAMDLDLRGPGHKAQNYPETEQELLTLLRKAGLPEPSVWVHSGGGRYPIWKLDQPADLTLPGELERAATLSRKLHRLVIEWADESGWKVDNTSDLARVYRLPGTHNRKHGEPVLAHVLWAESDSTAGYTLEDLGHAVDRAPRSTASALTSTASAASAASRTQEEGVSQLFGTPSALADERTFSVAEAMVYVQPFLAALRAAPDGEINVCLNDAAMVMAHFGEEFWSREAAVRQLMAALAETVYDGATWQAETTIASAYNAMVTKVGPEFWRATLRPELATVIESTPIDAVDALLAEMLTPGQMENIPPPRHLIRGVLTLDSESWMVGGPGSKKSFTALDMGACISLGRPWQGLPTTQGRVMFIVAEGASGSGKRVKAWQKTYGQMGEVLFLPRPVQAASLEKWAVLVGAAARWQPIFVVIDTQARVTVGLEENSAKDMGVFVEAVRAIREVTGACVMPIHHTGRRGQDARGSSALDGAQSTELTVVADGLSGSLKITKQKDLDERADIPLHFTVVDLGVDDAGVPVTSLVLADPDAWRDAVAASAVEMPEPWETGHAAVIVQLFKVLRDQGGERGLTKAEARIAVIERFYDNDSKRLNKSTWFSGWSRALEKRAASGDPVMVNTGGERFGIDPLALRDLDNSDKDG